MCLNNVLYYSVILLLCLTLLGLGKAMLLLVTFLLKTSGVSYHSGEAGDKLHRVLDVLLRYLHHGAVLLLQRQRVSASLGHPLVHLHTHTHTDIPNKHYVSHTCHYTLVLKGSFYFKCYVTCLFHEAKT